jgi:hypothetical protein
MLSINENGRYVENYGQPRSSGTALYLALDQLSQPTSAILREEMIIPRVAVIVTKAAVQESIFSAIEFQY